MTKRCYRCGAPLYEMDETAGSQEQPIKLTDIDKKVWLLIAKGKSNAEICRELRRSRGTVNGHVERVMSRLGARNRAQAVAMLRDAGLL